MTDSARIRLAEAMGWERVYNYAVDAWKAPNNGPIRMLDDIDGGIPNPFKRVVDDYAVLEWLRKENPEGWTDYLAGRQYHYEKGNIARAACAALGIELEEE